MGKELKLLLLISAAATTAYAVAMPRCDGLGYKWTQYFDVDNPTGTCDCETHAKITAQFPKLICANPTAVDARVKNIKLDYRLTGQKLSVNKGDEKGLRCLNKDNSGGCHDYEIRFCCDYDECQDNPCNQHATCRNTVGSYTCTCKRGYTGDGYHCEVAPRVCPGGFQWTRFYNRDKPTAKCDCEKLDDLRRENPGQICANPLVVDARLAKNNIDYRLVGQTVTIGGGSANGFQCYNAKNPGGCLDYKARFCCDVNECASSPCHARATCTNTPGSFKCRCLPGFVGDGFTCYPEPVCPSGFSWTNFYDRDNPTASGDIETLSHLRQENPGQICENPRSIKVRRISNKVDYRVVGQTVEASAREGFACRNNVNNPNCYDYEIRFCCDINECASSPCDSNAQCTNTPGSFTCQCNPGYTGNGFKCFRIPTCPTGHKWTDFFDRDNPTASCDCEQFTELRKENPGKICDNPNSIDVRLVSNNNDYRRAGQNVIAGTKAEKGFQCRNNVNKPKCLDYKIRFCCDVNECLRKPCHANARCTNTPGSFRCQCKPGFIGNGFRCVPVPVCSHGYKWTEFFDRDNGGGTGDIESFPLLRSENPGKICANPTGIHARRVSNRADYRLTGQRITAATSAEKGLVCRNSINNPDCYDYEIRFCCDIDECASSPCHVNAKCTNLPGSYKCECNDGFIGNGFACVTKPTCNFRGHRWTSFYDRDDPTGVCDCERFSELRKEHKGICAKPKAIHARVKVSEVDYRLAGQRVTAYTAEEKGLVCLNDQNPGKCHDYEIRFCCPYFPFG